MIIKRTSFDLDFLMACRYAYYVKAVNLIPDHEYDRLEKEYELLNDPLPVGSDQESSYSEAQRALALYFLFSGCFSKQNTDGLSLLQ